MRFTDTIYAFDIRNLVVIYISGSIISKRKPHVSLSEEMHFKSSLKIVFEVILKRAGIFNPTSDVIRNLFLKIEVIPCPGLILDKNKRDSVLIKNIAMS